MFPIILRKFSLTTKHALRKEPGSVPRSLERNQALGAQLGCGGVVPGVAVGPKKALSL